MSDSGNPFDRDRGERTVIRVNPGAPRPQPASPGAGRPQETAAPPSDHGGGRIAGSSGAQGSEDWIRAEERPTAPAQGVNTLPDIDLAVLASPHDNPIMRAAGPLLILLGRLRAAVMRAPFATLMEQVAEAMRFFEKDIRAAGVPEEQARAAKYVLCATADDIVQNIPTDDRHVWTRYSMLARFFNERVGGVRFFEEVDRAKLDPIRNFPLLELQYTCLALGFQGMHRSSTNGQSALQRLQRELYEILRQVRPRLERELSPRWQGLTLARSQGWFRVPVWTAWSVACLALLGAYVGLRMLLNGGTEATIERMRAMLPQTPISIEQRVFAEPLPPPPPPPPASTPRKMTQLERIRAGLAPEIAAGQVDAVQTATMIIVRVGNLVSFPSASATPLKQFEPIGARIAAVLDNEPRRILVVGHTDNTAISGTSRFSSNLHLSQERAKAVAEVLKRGLKDPSRLVVKGVADEQPLASNKTSEGRARNRRVEMSIERDD